VANLTRRDGSLLAGHLGGLKSETMKDVETAFLLGLGLVEI